MDAIIEEMIQACQEDPEALSWFEGFAAADKSARQKEGAEQ